MGRVGLMPPTTHRVQSAFFEMGGLHPQGMPTLKSSVSQDCHETQTVILSFLPSAFLLVSFSPISRVLPTDASSLRTFPRESLQLVGML